MINPGAGGGKGWSGPGPLINTGVGGAAANGVGPLIDPGTGGATPGATDFGAKYRAEDDPVEPGEYDLTLCVVGGGVLHARIDHDELAALGMLVSEPSPGNATIMLKGRRLYVAIKHVIAYSATLVKP